ncbi:MAG: HAD hydrolase family protein [Candidatus Methanomethylophilus sp.]|nr:HAD hydrolase family protein [Methanomethylophilus sp.]
MGSDSKISMIVMDVDGTLTDGKIYMGDNGEIFKSFDIRDGYGIKYAQKYCGVTFAIITGRKSKIVENRCKELEIGEIHQGVENKLSTLREIAMKYFKNNNEIAYIGDDLIDLECMRNVGMAMAPNNAVEEVKNAATYISSKNGGDGAVRDCIDYLLRNNMFRAARI